MSIILQIPESFFTTILTKPKIYSRVWFYWLGSSHGSKLLEENYVLTIIAATPKSQLYTDEDLTKIFNFGVEILKANNFSFIDDSIVDMSVVEESKNKKKVVKDQFENECATVINTLNEITGSTFTTKSQSTMKLIRDRLKEGYTVEDLIEVIQIKSKQWLNTPDAIYLRPITLFNKSKFENYLNVNKNATGSNNPQQGNVVNGQERFTNILTALEEANRNTIIRSNG